ncbi:MAG: D-alanyl-D-alanine carboxypeptidase [Deltaproteobacteria bacterium]|nr:D-alanyl-D-alanine carboxypeptidase [Deltaproteobacteria bacterium]
MPSRLIPRTIVTAGTFALSVVALQVAFSPVDGSTEGTTVPPARPAAPGWTPPAWYPAVPDVLALSAMDGPEVARGRSLERVVRSPSAFVYDLDAGEILLARRADDRRPVASLTKLTSALTLASTEPDLESQVCVGIEFRPTRSGARSRFHTGDCVSGFDALGAALVASDNRGAYALSGVAGLGVDDFVVHMNEVSEELGMTLSSWSDPSGLEDDNLSTARDVGRAALAVAAHPVLSTVATAPFWDVHFANRTRRLFTTDRLSAREDLEIEAAKTGYTDTAGYCYATVLRPRGGPRLVVALLGDRGRRTRFADVSRIVAWAREHG